MRSIWIDTDCALGAPRGDVDDGFAIAAALCDPVTKILGVSTVFGNTSSRTAARAVRALLDAAGVSLPVHEGAARAGEDTGAAEALAAIPPDTEILALGPLTNIVAAHRRNPALAARARVRLVGGNLTSRGRFPPIWPFEFNLAKDAPAARRFFDSAIPRRLFTLDVCERLRVGAADLARIGRLSPFGAYLAHHSRRWLAYAPLRYRARRFPLWDLVPALDAIDRLGRLGPTVEERRLRLRGWGRLVPDATAPPTEIVRSFDVDAALRAFEESLTAPPAGSPPATRPPSTSSRGAPT